MSNNRLPADEYEAGDAAASADGAFNGAAASFRERAEEFLGGTRAQEMADAATERMSATADYLRNTGASRMKSDVEELVKRNPGPALLIAGTLGFLIGRTLSRD